MTANSYLEYALTILGWLVSNGIWDTIVSTGLFGVPLLMKLVAHVLKAREQGVDEGDAEGLTLAWMENTVYVAMTVIMFTCVPLLNLDITDMQFDTQRSTQCNFSVPVAPAQSGYAPQVNDMSGRTAMLPLCIPCPKVSPVLPLPRCPVSRICGNCVSRCSIPASVIRYWQMNFRISP